jgi:hypothetical protein
MEVLLLASSSKDNTRGKLERVEMDSYGFWVYGKINSTLTCSTLSPDMGDYLGWIGLSPPVVYPSIVGYEANKGSL